MTRGVAVDQNGDVWTSCYSTNKLLKFNAAGTLLGSWPVGAGPVGAAVDGDRKIWTVNQSANTATRFDPLTGTTQSFPTGGAPYSYSDMTGFQQRNFTQRQGDWTVVHDSATENAVWGAGAVEHRGAGQRAGRHQHHRGGAHRRHPGGPGQRALDHGDQRRGRQAWPTGASSR